VKKAGASMPTFFKKLRKFKKKGEKSQGKSLSKPDLDEILKRPPQSWNGDDVAALQSALGNQRVLGMLYQAGLLGNDNKLIVDDSEQLEKQEEAEASNDQNAEEQIEVNPADLDLDLDDLRAKYGGQPRQLLAILKAKRAKMQAQSPMRMMMGVGASITAEIELLEDLLGQQEAKGLPLDQIRSLYLAIEEFHQKLETLSDDPNARYEAVKKLYLMIVAYPETVRRYFPPGYMVLQDRQFAMDDQGTSVQVVGSGGATQAISFEMIVMNPGALVKALGPQGIMRWIREMGRPQGL
jgi:hypothetical protein